MSLLRRILGPPDVQKHLERRDVAKLTGALRDDGAATRAAAAAALGKLGDESAALELIKTLDDPEKSVTDAVTTALSQMSPAVIQLLTPVIAEGHTWTRADKGARAVIAAISSREFNNAAPILRDLLRHREWRVRHVAREMLIAQREAALPHAIAALQDANPEARKTAAEIAGALRSVEAVEALVPVLRDGDASVREAAAVAVGNIGDNRAAPGVIELLTDAEDAPRIAAIKALGKIRSREAVQPLIGALDGANDSLICEIAQALNAIGDGAAAPSLRSALEKTENPESREAILEAITSLRDPSAKSLLLTELRTEEKRLTQRHHVDGRDCQLVKSVIASLASIGGDDVAEELTKRRNSPLSYDVGDRDNSERFFPIRDAVRTALALMGRRDATEGSARSPETKTGRFEIGS